MKKRLCCIVLTFLAVNTQNYRACSALSLEEADTIAELKAVIRRQQEQIDTQAKAIAALQQALQQQDKKSDSPSSSVVSKLHVKTRSEKIGVTLYGQINRALLYVDDGQQDAWRHVDSDKSGTRFGIKAQKKISEDFEFGGKFEVGYQSNISSDVSMDVDSIDGGFTERYMDIYLHSAKFGRVSVGQGDTASNGRSESDLSGVWLSGVHVGVHDISSSFTFYNKTAADYTTSTGTVGDFFNSMDGLSRRDRIRYDLPTFAGITFSGSLTEKNGNDLALCYIRDFQSLNINAAGAYAHPGKGFEFDQFNGSLSVRHNVGVSLTLSAGHRDYDKASESDASFYYGKLAHETKFWETGTTAFGIDYGKWDDVSHTLGIGDDASSYGIGIVQNVTDWSTEFYAAYRIYTLERSGVIAEFEDIQTFWGGLRFKF